MYFQARLQCADIPAGKCTEDQCSKMPIMSPWNNEVTNNKCAVNITQLATIPGADECCCPQDLTSLLTITSPDNNSSSSSCTQHRKCQFLCCASPAKFCGMQCCQKDELCGAKLRDGAPCCIAPYPRLVQSPHAPSNLMDILHAQAQHSCCAYGVGEVCNTGTPCCLDVGNAHCVPAGECPVPSTWHLPHLFFMMVWPIFITLTLIGCLTVGTGIWRVTMGDTWHRVHHGVRTLFNRQRRSGELTSGGIYGNASSILSHSEEE